MRSERRWVIGRHESSVVGLNRGLVVGRGGSGWLGGVEPCTRLTCTPSLQYTARNAKVHIAAYMFLIVELLLTSSSFVSSAVYIASTKLKGSHSSVKVRPLTTTARANSRSFSQEGTQLDKH